MLASHEWFMKRPQFPIRNASMQFGSSPDVYNNDKIEVIIHQFNIIIIVIISNCMLSSAIKEKIKSNKKEKSTEIIPSP